MIDQKRMFPMTLDNWVLKTLNAGVTAALVFIVVLCCCAGCQGEEKHVRVHFENPDKSISPTVRALVADNNSSRQIGLMNKKELGSQEGMFFIFETAEVRAFWMKNTYIALDIIFMDEKYRVVSISEDAVPLTTTPRRSSEPAMYVLEVNAGSAAKWGVKKGSVAVVE